MDVKLLGIYLKDHLAGSRAGLELARRAERENRGNRVGEYLARLVTELEQDRAILEQVARGLGVRHDMLKEVTAWVAERLERLKPNGRLVSYSPLSRMLELEGLCLGSQGRLCLWHALERLARTERRLMGFDFAALIVRTEAQLKALDRLRLQAADTAFSHVPLPDEASAATVH